MSPGKYQRTGRTLPEPGGEQRRPADFGGDEWLDLVGLDTSLAILDALYTEFRDPNYAAVPLLRRMVAAGQLGRKTKLGFYDYAR